MRASSRSTRARSRSRKVSGPEAPGAGLLEQARERALVMGRPRGRRLTAWMPHGQAGAWPWPRRWPGSRPRRGRGPSRPPRTRRHALERPRTAAAGNGRNEPMPTTPDALARRSRRSSTTSLIVPRTEPSATTTVSASSLRYGLHEPTRRAARRTRRTRPRSRGCGRAPAAASRARGSAPPRRPRDPPWPRWTRARGGRAPGAARRAAGRRPPAAGWGPPRASKAWVRMKPSMHTITGIDSSSARRKAWTWRSAASWLVSAKSWIQPRRAPPWRRCGRSRC